MKTFIILGALIISTSAFSQVRVEKQIEQSQTQVKQQVEKVQQDVKQKVEQTKEQVSKVGGKGTGNGDGNGDGKGNGGANGKGLKNEAMSIGDKANAAAQDKLKMVEGKIGQGKSAEAKLKAKQVKTKADADAMIRMSKEDTKETMSAIDTKMVSARSILTEKLSAGEITQVQFDEKIKTLMDFEKRKNSLLEEMK